jgi:hypothetical protein
MTGNKFRSAPDLNILLRNQLFEGNIIKQGNEAAFCR